MGQTKANLGLCFFENQLYYAINDPKKIGRLSRIGSVDFNFELEGAIISGNGKQFSGIQHTINTIRENFDINHIRILTLPTLECWTTLPKIVYDEPDEREDHIRILMHGVERKDIEPTWHTLSNQDYKFLLLRNKSRFEGYDRLASSASAIDLYSEFEIGEKWAQHADTSGSFLTICGFKDCITVSSFILGNLRGSTYLRFDDEEDLPYLWLQSAQQLNWMQGLHEYIFVYGFRAYRIIEILKPFWDEAAEIIKMDSLGKMKVESDEQTYSFNLERAFPAILMALDP